MSHKLQEAIAMLLNPITLVLSIIITFAAVSCIHRDHSIEIAKAECKHHRSK